MADKKKLPRQPSETHAVSPTALLPSQIICLFNEDTWEEFVLEWLDGAEPAYPHFDRIGGAGDKGRDIVAYTGPQDSDCDVDIFQCKHYNHPLRPSDIWAEIGKLCVYTWRDEYPIPRKYRFVAPRGVSTRLHDLLSTPERLKDELIANWDQCCKKVIRANEVIPLEGALLKHVRDFDFRKIGYEPPHAILEQHLRTPHWHRRFKRDFPVRPEAIEPPGTPEIRELPYVDQLKKAYSEHLKKEINALTELEAHPEIKSHFSRSRVDFFMADSLNRFYRDQFQEGAFDDVKKQIFDGIIDIVDGEHVNGYQRLIATTQQAVQVQLAQSDYVPYVQPSDRKGICHHLVNDSKIKWTK